MKSLPRICAALIVLAGAASLADAQVITSGEIERGLRYRNTTSFDGMPHTQRYLSLPNAYLNGDSRQLWYLHYLDRVDRAEKFGYRMPIDPYFSGPPPEPTEVVESAPPPPPVRAGFGFGIFRRR